MSWEFHTQPARIFLATKLCVWNLAGCLRSCYDGSNALSYMKSSKVNFHHDKTVSCLLKALDRNRAHRLKCRDSECVAPTLVVDWIFQSPLKLNATATRDCRYGNAIFAARLVAPAASIAEPAVEQSPHDLSINHRLSRQSIFWKCAGSFIALQFLGEDFCGLCEMMGK